MAILKKITATVTSVDIGTPADVGTTQFGNGRNALLRVPTLPLTSVFKLQTATNDPDTKAVPAEDSSLWTDLATLSSTSDTVQEVTGLQRWVRWNTTRWSACSAMIGIDCTPEEPVPMIPTRRPVKSTPSWGQVPVW